MPSKETIDKVYDNLDFTHAFEAFVNTFQGVSIAGLHKGFQSVGVKDNEVLIFSDLMDAKSLFLTANADTIYSLGMLDLSKGPMVLEVGPKMLGASTTSGSAGLSIWARPGLIAVKAGSISSCRPATRVTCPRAATLWPAPAPTSLSGSLARSWRTTIRSRWSNRSRKHSRSIRTKPAARHARCRIPCR